MSNWVILGEYLDKDVLVQTEAILNGNQISFQVKTPESHLNSAFGQGTSFTPPLTIGSIEQSE